MTVKNRSDRWARANGLLEHDPAVSEAQENPATSAGSLQRPVEFGLAETALSAGVSVRGVRQHLT